MLRFAFCALVTVSLAACVAGREARLASAQSLASKAALKEEVIQTSDFTIAAFTRISESSAPLTIYIEGDGLAWISKTRLSSDPTPRDALALRLAARDSSANVAYLARPCQFLGVGQNPRCGAALWSSHRFSEQAVAAMDQAVTALAQRVQDQKLHLVGYSGGAAIAALIAVRRGDVASLRSVAGNLDHVWLNAHHKVSPLRGSLNAADVAGDLADLPQVHFLGQSDKVVPPAMAAVFLAKLPHQKCAASHAVPGATHEDGWAEAWPRLLAMTPLCR